MEKPVAKLLIEVEYSELPDTNAVTELVDKARELGHVKVAELTVLREVKVNLK